MTTAAARIQADLTARQSLAERNKIARRLPPDSGLAPIGVRMREVFETAKAWTGLDVADVPALLTSPLCEMRMVGVSILDFKAQGRGLSDHDRRDLYDTYLDNHDVINVWDLVDRAAPRVVGGYLLDRSRAPLFDLAPFNSADPAANSHHTAAFWLIGQGDLDDPIALADLLLDDESTLVSRPVRTALREIGKIDESRLLAFESAHHHRISRRRSGP